MKTFLKNNIIWRVKSAIGWQEKEKIKTQVPILPPEETMIMIQNIKAHQNRRRTEQCEMLLGVKQSNPEVPKEVITLMFTTLNQLRTVERTVQGILELSLDLQTGQRNNLI